MRTTAPPAFPGNGTRRLRFGLTAIVLLLALGVADATRWRPASAEILLAGNGRGSTQPQPTPGAGDPAVGAAGGAASRSFSISGNVAGLYPGATRPLVLTVTNPLKVAITVTSITTVVANASPSCLSENVMVTAFQGSLPIPAGKSAHATVPTTMAHTSPDACQGRIFPLHYIGTATAA